MMLLNIKILCNKKQIKLNDLADQVGITSENLSECMKNNKIDIIILEKIAHVLCVPMNYFFNEELNHNTANIKGNNNVLIGGGNVTISSNKNESTILMLKCKLKHLYDKLVEKDKMIAEKDKMIQEKDRLITVLMKR